MNLVGQRRRRTTALSLSSPQANTQCTLKFSPKCRKVANRKNEKSIPKSLASLSALLVFQPHSGVPASIGLTRIIYLATTKTQQILFPILAHNFLLGIFTNKNQAFMQFKAIRPETFQKHNKFQSFIIIKQLETWKDASLSEKASKRHVVHTNIRNYNR